MRALSSSAALEKLWKFFIAVERRVAGDRERKSLREGEREIERQRQRDRERDGGRDKDRVPLFYLGR